MISRFVAFFVNRHLLTNLFFLSVIGGGIFAWSSIKKEEMPDITFDWIRISANYPGATAEEVEYFVTRELEKAVKSVDGVFRITSSASRGSTRVSVELEKSLPNKDETITEIRNAVLSAELPPQVRDKPSVRVYKTSKKAIVDLAIYNRNQHLLDGNQRRQLQQIALALENQLLGLAQINSINRGGYLQPELQIQVDPRQLTRYAIPLSQVMREVRQNHIRRPAGHMEVKDEPNVTVNAQLDSVKVLQSLYVQAGFKGKAVALADIAEVRNAFRRDKQIIKINGHEAVMFNVVKNGSYGILEALDVVRNQVARFKASQISNTVFDVVFLDDESIDVRNRLSIIAMNGTIGIVLILVTLFLFLNKGSAVWVAMGIPFTICLTLVAAVYLGYTINNVTLAAVIIVMGIVVDDAIVVAENISRHRALGYGSQESAVLGTSQVFLPVTASILTTCIAFVPLYYFSGRYGYMNSFIPPVVFIMLGASLLEALVVLPGHMHFRMPGHQGESRQDRDSHWFDRFERAYGRILALILPYRYLVLAFFAALLLLALMLMVQSMKFVMFPHSETREIVISAYAGKKADRYETAEKTRLIETILQPYLGKQVVGMRTEIARSRRGGAVEENRFRIVVEIVPKEKRQLSADALVALWKPQIEKIPGLRKLVVRKSRWGHGSGSAMEVIVRENDDTLRQKAAAAIVVAMDKHPVLVNAEIEKPPVLPEYKIDIRREKAKRLGINPSDIADTLRASLEGEILYELVRGDETVDVRLSVIDQAKKDLDGILSIPVENRSGYLVPLRDLVIVNPTQSSATVSRRDEKRVTTVFADLKKGAAMTPVEIADQLEAGIFASIVAKQPSTTLSFDGEVRDTRESTGDFANAVIMVVFMIFAVLAVLFNSVFRPVIIMLAIPFGVVGVIFAFLLHGQLLFGFFAAVGTLGMAGVVINDAIIMISRLDREFSVNDNGGINKKIAEGAQTRLKAVILTTLTTVAGVMPTAYGLAGYDAMLSEMMMALAWGLLFGSLITLILVPCLYRIMLSMPWLAGSFSSGPPGGLKAGLKAGRNTDRVAPEEETQTTP